MRTILLAVLLVMECGMSAQRKVTFQPARAVCFQNPMMPLPILEHFARKFPDATPYWGIEGTYYFLRYVDPSTSLARSIIYDRFGTIVRCENEVSFSDCPVSLQQYYLRNYPDETLRIWCCESGSERKYFLRRGDLTVWFDRDGNFISKQPS